MLSSLPIILILILQGFGRQTGAELLGNCQGLGEGHVYARSIKSFDDLISAITFARQESTATRVAAKNEPSGLDRKVSNNDFQVAVDLREGFLEIRRTRDGPQS